jgi:beta-galactosidase
MMQRKLAALMAWSLLAFASRAAVQCPLEFAPREGIVKFPEQPYRQELCLNGSWQFQPISLPEEFAATQGVAPELTPPQAGRWSATPIKIPSHWNVNTWGGGRPNRKKANQMYWPDSIYYPSYPIAWDAAKMGWLRRRFRVPDKWNEQRLVLHFEAVSGDCQVWLNGEKIKEHFDNYLPFEVDVSGQVRRDAENELLVGIRGANLYNKTNSHFPKFAVTHPPGSETDPLIGIWQDVFLLALPLVHIADVFVKPLVKQGLIEAEVTLINASQQDQTVQIGAEICPWTRSATEPGWRLDPAVLSIEARKVTVKAGLKATIVLRRAVEDQLRLWSPRSPNLYGLVLLMSAQGKSVDRHYTRFGWREFTIQNSDLLLNGDKIKLMGEWAHPFGAYVMSPRYVQAWYQMVKDFGGNAVRPHAQIHPRFYMELADEMGILILDETAIFGSSVRLNTEEPVFWERCASQYDGLVLRDRNHPSVMGWSFANEMFAIPRHNKFSPTAMKSYNEKLSALSRRSLALDPTRTWITSDGDEDLNGSLPVWSRHFGVGNHVDELPKDLNKPLVVSESGGAYFATPEQLSVFNGDRAYESYLGRNEALAIDHYDNAVNMALPYLTYFSTRQIVWWGLEHLNLGYNEFSRLPNEADGVFFVKPFVEGKPGMQPERIPPYATTLNPGWDASLPLSKPLPVFYAMKAALAPGGPKPCPWDHKSKPVTAGIAPPIAEGQPVYFTGSGRSPLRKQLIEWGVSLAEAGATHAGFMVIDGQSLVDDQLADIRGKMEGIFASGGTVLLMVCDDKVPIACIDRLLPAPLELTQRRQTMVAPCGGDPWLAGLRLKDFYFAGEEGDCDILKCGLAGPLVKKGSVVLEAAATDWALFNNMPQKSKAAAVTLYEHLQKPSGSALVRIPQGSGTLAVCSLDYRLASPSSQSMWQHLLANMGVEVKCSKHQVETQSSTKNKENNQGIDPLFLNEK